MKKIAPLITAVAVAGLTITRHNHYEGTWNLILWIFCALGVGLITLDIYQRRERLSKQSMILFGVSLLVTILLFVIQSR